MTKYQQTTSAVTQRQRKRAASPGKRATMTVARGLDYPLIAILATMLALGLVMVYSASFVQAGAHFFLSQIMWIALGIGALFVTANIPYRFWQRMAIPIMLVALVLLVAVLIFGDEVNNAQRTLFNGRVQPSEAAKLAVVIYVAAWVSSKGKQLAEVEGGLIPFAILMGLVAALVIMEPSFSVAIVLLTIGVTIFFVGGGDIKQLLIVGAIGSVVLLLLLWQSDYGFARIQAWWRALSDPSHASYDIATSMRMLHRGFRISFGADPSEWMDKWAISLLWSDYLFTNIGHDLGFIGAVTVVGLFAAFGYRGLGIALNAPDQFSGLTAIGIVTWVLTQAIVHIGTSLALIPATGQPLPFMSYGGSSMVSCMAAMGLLLSISRAATEKKAPYAHFAFGWGNWRPRVPDSGRGQRSKTARSVERKSAGDRGQGAGGRRQGAGGRRQGAGGRGQETATRSQARKPGGRTDRASRNTSRR
ncbi:MAG: hypothetical protein CVU38_02075 [Chloroflexi bacterium HGW-Chloroflexi-1]|nr:MAG: hypothetical protein CVU38_02075 [Chloroflexi bacterium HGW-Chloroflexi-1]